MKEAEVKEFKPRDARDCPVENELIQRINKIIKEYPDITNVSVIGCLELVKKRYIPNL